MNKAKIVITLIESGGSPKDVAQEIPWGELSGEDRSALVAYAKEKCKSIVAFNLIRYLYMVSQDEVFTIQVMQLAANHPQLDLKQRFNTLDAVHRRINKLEGDLEKQFYRSRYTLEELRAHYHYLYGINLREGGDQEGALLHMQRSQEILEDLNSSTTMDEIGEKILDLKKQILDDKIKARQYVLEELEEQIQTLRSRLRILENQLEDFQWQQGS